MREYTPDFEFQNDPVGRSTPSPADRIYFFEVGWQLQCKAEQLREKVQSDDATHTVEPKVMNFGPFAIPDANCWRQAMNAVREFRANHLESRAQDFWRRV